MIIALLPLQISGISSAAVEATPSQAPSDNSISQPITLSFEDAVEKAINNYTAIKGMDISLKRLWRVKDKDETFEVMDASAQKRLDKLDNYLALTNREANREVLTTDEQNELIDCSEEFGYIPPQYSREYAFDSYTQSSAFPQYSGWLQVQNIKNSRDIIKSQLKQIVRNTYNTVLIMQDVKAVTEQSLETMEKQYKILQLQYEKGLVTELDTYQCQVSLDKTKRELTKQERDIKNMQMQLKNLCGIPLSQKIELSSTELPAATKLQSYDTYYKKALMNRNEIVYAKLELSVFTRKLDILKDFKKNSYSFDKMEFEEQIEDAKIAVSQSLETVTSDIQWAYADVTALQLNMNISKKNADNAKANLSIMETKYKQGQVNLITLWNARDSANTAEVDYRKSLRDFALASNNLELASGLGPKYKQD
jgi:hypothetical protein